VFWAVGIAGSRAGFLAVGFGHEDFGMGVSMLSANDSASMIGSATVTDSTGC